MKGFVLSLGLSCLGWLCLVTVCCHAANKPPPVPIPPQLGSIVLVVACLWSLRLAISGIGLAAKAAMLLSAAPIFVMLAAAGFAAAGIPGALAAAGIPLFIAIRHGFSALAAVTLLITLSAAGIAFIR